MELLPDHLAGEHRQCDDTIPPTIGPDPPSPKKVIDPSTENQSAVDTLSAASWPPFSAPKVPGQLARHPIPCHCPSRLAPHRVCLNGPSQKIPKFQSLATNPGISGSGNSLVPQYHRRLQRGKRRKSHTLRPTHQRQVVSSVQVSRLKSAMAFRVARACPRHNQWAVACKK